MELRDIDKRFGPVHANREVSLSVPAGVIHGIVGENGAGKSTLMNILYGFYEADRGEILVEGKRRRIRNSADAIAAGIDMVHQHFMLVDSFTVLENVMLGSEGGATLAGGVRAARQALARLGEDFGLKVPANALVGDLPVGLQQRVEILKALHRGARILILDEPTSVLTPQETEQLFRILGALRDQGVTVILITHKLREIMAITDSVSVMRQGRMVAHLETRSTDREALAELMVGRKVLLRVEKTPAQPGAAVLQVAGLTLVDATGVARLDGVGLELRAGEIVGIAGVSGNGQSELLEVLAGIRPFDKGRVRLGTTEITPEHRRNPAEMRRLKVAHVPEDRLRSGVVPAFEARESFILGYHDDPAYNGAVFTDMAAILEDCAANMAKYDVRPADPGLGTRNFSGGNQQKLVLARELERAPDVLLVGQPTRGVDIGAIEFIHRSLIAMRDAGSAVLLVSVELDEVMSLADRILVVFEGRIVGEVGAGEADERDLGLMMANIVPEHLRPDGEPPGDG
ncbi:MAG: ABC transporter ATP-binding protein [Alphaproteobacteria bacterium]|nr:ABC transporter ATP-binding protein [Alphaproteobacteria bacterium]